MKIFLKIGSFVLVICVIAAGLLLPDSIFGYMDRKNKNVKTNELPAVKLEFSYGMSLSRKIELALNGAPTAVVSDVVASSNTDDIINTAKGIARKISAYSHRHLEPNIVIDEVLPVVFVMPMSDMNAVFWVVRGNFGMDRYAFIIDDETKNLLSFSYCEDSFPYYIGNVMWRSAECVREIVYDQFGVGKWSPNTGSFEYSNYYDDIGKAYTVLETYHYVLPDSTNYSVDIPLIYDSCNLIFGRDLGSLHFGSSIEELKY